MQQAETVSQTETGASGTAGVRALSFKFIGGAIAAIAAAAGLAANINTINDLFTPSVAGPWQLTTISRKATVPKYVNLPLTYRVDLTQTDKKITGTGYKFLENGRAVPPAQQQPIEITGEITGGTLSATYTLKPGRNHAARETTGEFQLHIVRAGIMSTAVAKLEGTFAAQAADSSGDTTAVPWHP